MYGKHDVSPLTQQVACNHSSRLQARVQYENPTGQLVTICFDGLGGPEWWDVNQTSVDGIITQDTYGQAYGGANCDQQIPADRPNWGQSEMLGVPDGKLCRILVSSPAR